MYNSQYYTCEQIDQRLLQGYLDDYNSQNNVSLTKAQFLTKLYNALENYEDESEVIDLIEDYLGNGFLYAGLATPTGTPTLPQNRQAQLVFIAINPGTYTNYGNINITNVGLHLILWDTDTWSYDTVLEVDQQTGQSTTKTMSQKAITNLLSLVSDSNIKANIGYYECDTAGATAAKTIAVANYDLFVGGSMKVKFANKNTANDVTLNVNSQGAKALYYQGERASATNSWDDNDVVEIYYDGISYYANNVKGGSGSGVYDVSKEHPTSGPNSDGKFTLEYILNPSNVNELIPVNKRYPGMSIQFVSTSDNKYVRHNLLADSFTTDVTQWAIADEGVYVENPEFAEVKLDGAGRILWGIQKDGNVYFGAGVPQQVVDYIEEKIADLSLDEYEDIVAFLNGLEKGDETLQDLLDKKVDGEYTENNEWAIVTIDNNNKVIEGTQKDGSKYIGGSAKINGNLSTKNIDANGFSTETTENSEFLEVEISQDNKLLRGTRKDGSYYIRELDSESLDRKVDKEEGKELVDSEIASRISFKESTEYIEASIDNENKVLEGTTVEGKKVVNIPVEVNNKFGVKGNSVDGITDIEDRVEVIADANNKVIAYRKTDGTLVENVGIETPNGKIDTLVVNDLQLSEKSKAELLGDASNPYLRLDRVDIISDLLTVSGNNIYPLTEAKNEVGDVDSPDVLFKYTSKDGTFTDNCVIAYQGNSSIQWAKKGFAVDLQNKHRFKDWIEHDSFNIKAYATDWMHVREYIGTTIYEQMMQHRPLGHKRPWEVYNDFSDDNYANGCPSSALGHSDQHPVELYINGNYWGLYSISLKKKKDNYEMKKNNAKHIMLDADGFSCAGSSFSWGGAEIRFPKEDKSKHNLLDKDLNTYDGDHPTELLGADNPLYDANNPTHVFCNTVKQRILTFYQFMHDIDSNTTKAQIEDHFNVEEFIDNYLHTNFICNSDVGGKNTLYCTWDGVHFAPLAYDFDLTFGCGWNNGMAQIDVHLAFERYPASNREGAWNCIPGAAEIKRLYQTEIEARYKELRDCGIFSAENVANIIKDWMIEVGEDVYKDDLDRWDGVYGNRGTKNMYGEDDVECYVNQIALYNYIVTRLVSLDTLFNYI